MKMIGLIGGTGWVSTMDYYRLINEKVHARLGRSNAASILLHSFNFQEIKDLLDKHDWNAIGDRYVAASQTLHQAGAACIAFAANTPHMIAERVRREVPLPLIHISEATASTIAERRLERVALLGTMFTMEQPFFRDQLSEQGFTTIVPGDDDRKFIHHSILEEMTKGIFTDAARARYQQIIEALQQADAQAIVYACTEMPILLKDVPISLPTFDTTEIHTDAIVGFALH